MEKAATRVFGHRQTSITTWLTRAFSHSATLHDRTFRDLHLPHVQVDEIRTRLRSRAGAYGCGSPVTLSPKSLRCCIWVRVGRLPPTPASTSSTSVSLLFACRSSAATA